MASPGSRDCAASFAAFIAHSLTNGPRVGQMTPKHLFPLAALVVSAPVLAQVRLTAAEQAAAFQAAGFKKFGPQWRRCNEPNRPGYVPGSIDTIRDLNGDGRPEAIVSEGSVFCYGASEASYAIVSRQANRKWKLIARGTGLVSVLSSKGAAGWPDLEVGKPGFCFSVLRWDGVQYKLLRRAYSGKTCF